MGIHSLSARIFALIAAVSLAGMALLSQVVVRMHAADLERATVAGGMRLSDTLRRSTRLGMLQNRKGDVYEALRQVAQQDGIQRIRIYNKEGTVVYSTAADENGLTVDTRAEACTHCHATAGAPVARPDQKELTRIFRDEGDQRLLGIITPVYNEAACARPGCHPGPAQQQILGVLDLQLSLAAVDRATAAGNERLQVLVYSLMLVMAGTCGLFVWAFVHRPVKELIRGTERVRAGQLDHRIPVRTRTEIGRLAHSFNQMSAQLDAANRQVTEWTRTLEERVEQKTRTVQQAQAKIVHNEKMASLGTLSAVVAHEINNPLSGVLTYAKLVRRLLREGRGEERRQDLDKYLGAMERETARCGDIVRNLLEFSSQSGMAVGAADLNEVLERTLFLIGHKLELQQIALQRQLAADLPRVTCDAAQVQQALLALLMNAVEAMPEGGTLTVVTRRRSAADGAGEWVVLEVRDTGVGIPDEVLPRIFEPFFSTKQDKHGVGLGLSVVYGIVQRHHGEIDVESEPGLTTFSLALPVRSELEEQLLAHAAADDVQQVEA